jgi:outer membrane protein TolC
LVAENRRRVEVGALAPLDSRQAESQAASSLADLLQAQATRGTLERVLKNLLSDNYNEWANVTIQPTDALLAVPQQFNLQDSWRTGLAMRPDLLQAKLNLETRGYQVRFQKNQLYPQLDLVGSWGYTAGGASREFSDAFTQITSADNPFYGVGAAVTFPLGNTSARNSYKSAKVTKEQAGLQFKQIQQTTLIRIENAMALAEANFQRVAATREARLYAEAALEAEQTKLEKGKSTTFVVLQLQKDLTSARSAEIRALADYNIALARLAQNEGSTLDRRLITMQVTGAENAYAPVVFPAPPR